MKRLITILIFLLSSSCEKKQLESSTISIEFFKVSELSKHPPILVRQYEPNGVFEVAEPVNYDFSDWKNGVLDLTISKFPCRIDVEFTEAENAFYDQFTLQILPELQDKKITLVRCADLEKPYELSGLFCIFEVSKR